jgi:nucleotide-binding universal stress UspA family protein
MFQRILVPLDGSNLSERALPYASFLAQAKGGQVVLMRAIDTWATHVDMDEEAARQPNIEAELSQLAAGLTSEGVRHTTVSVAFGEAAGLIESTAASNDIDLIVMSTHGRRGLAKWAYGSVAERVFRLSTRPVLLIPPQTHTTWSIDSGPVLLPLDGSRVAEQALPFAKNLARALQAKISVLQVVEPVPIAVGAGTDVVPPIDYAEWVRAAEPYAADVARRVSGNGVPAVAKTVLGYAAASIVDEAEALSARAIVMASHGRTGVERAVLGSVATGVVQRASQPVLVVHAAHEPG